MKSDNELCQIFLNNVLENENITSIQIARELGCTKGFISAVKNGRSKFSPSMYDRFIDMHPSFAKYGSLSHNNEEPKNNVIRIRMLKNSYLTKDYTIRSKVDCSFIYIDKSIIKQNYSFDVTKSEFEAVTIANDSLEPLYKHNDRIILDTSVDELHNGFIYAFVHEGNLYVNEITSLGENKFKSTDICNKSFSFILERNLTTNIIGLVIPRIRF